MINIIRAEEFNAKGGSCYQPASLFEFKASVDPDIGGSRLIMLGAARITLLGVISFANHFLQNAGICTSVFSRHVDV